MKSTVRTQMNLAAMLGMFGIRSLPSLPKHPKPVYGRVVHSRGTFNAGRNEEKRAARNNPEKRMHMLANRRLRQRGVAA